MQNNKKILFVLASTLLAATIFVGCGSGDSTSNNNSESTSTSEVVSNDTTNSESTSEDISEDTSSSEHIHSYGEWTLTVEPTETEKGTATRTCSEDGEVDTAEVPALSDDTVWKVKSKVDPTCTEEGTIVYTSEYGEVTVHTDELGHTFGDWTITVKPTETEKGTATRTCTSDGYVDTVEVAALSDETVWTEKSRVQPLEGVAGKVVYTSIYGNVEIALDAYEYGDWELPENYVYGPTVTLVKNSSNGGPQKTTTVFAPAGSCDIVFADDALYTCTSTGSYKWTYDSSTKSFVTGNHEVNSSSSTLSFTPKVNGTVSFHLVGSSESYDKLTYNGQTESGSGVVKDVSFEVTAGTEYTFVYKKDSSTSSFSDQYTISNFKFESSEVKPDLKVVNFEVNNGKNPAPIVVIAGKTIDDSFPGLVKEGYVVEGWYSSSDFAEDTKVDGTTPINENVKLYANWVEARNVKVYDGETRLENINIAVNNKLTIEEPVKKGHKFVGFYTTATFEEETEWENGSLVTDNLVLYAKFDVVPYAQSYTYTILYGNSSTPGYYTTTSTDYAVEIDGNGHSPKGPAWPLAFGDIQVSEYNPEDNSLIIKCGSNEYRGYLDPNTNMIVMNNTSGRTSSFGTCTLFVPNETKISQFVSDSYWNSGKNRAIAYTKDGVAYNIYLSEGKVYFDVTYTANGEDIAAKDIYHSTNVVTVTAKDGTVIEEFGYNGSNIIAADGYQGTYTCGDKTVGIDGLGHITMDEKTASYTIASADSEYTIYTTLDGVYYEITLDKETKTGEVVKPMVTIHFECGVAGSQDDMSYNKNVYVSLPTLTSDEYVFKGWYSDAEFAHSVSSTYKPTESTTLYAKWNSCITVTLVDGDVETTTKVEEGTAYNEDKLEKEGYVFLGWFTDSTCETKYDGTAITTPTRLYADWMEAPAYIGSYVGVNLYGSGATGSGGTSQKTLTISNELKVTGKFIKTINGETYDAETGIVKTTDDYLFQYVETAGYKIICCADSISKTDTISVDFDVFVQGYTTITTKSQTTWCSGTYRIAILTLGDGSTTKDVVIYVDSVTNKVYADVTVKGDGETTLDPTKLYDSSTMKYVTYLAIADSEGNVVAGFAGDGSALTTLDGYQGTYSGATEGFTTFSINGVNKFTSGDVVGTYELVTGQENTIKVVVNNKEMMFVLNKEAKTYTTVADAYAGTYEGPDGTIVLDGYGTGTIGGTTCTYYVEGSTLYITVSEATTCYVIDIEGKSYLGKTIFAGYTFTGSYTDRSDNSSNSLKFVFADEATIKGSIYSGYGTTYYFDFTGEFDKATGTLTLTINKSIDSDQVGKVVVCSVSGHTITVTSTTISRYTYSFTGGTATCEEFNFVVE